MQRTEPQFPGRALGVHRCPQAVIVQNHEFTVDVKFTSLIFNILKYHYFDKISKKKIIVHNKTLPSSERIFLSTNHELLDFHK